MANPGNRPLPPNQAARREERHLAEADRHIADAERRITLQEQRIAEMEATGEDVREGRRLLNNLRDTLEQMHVHRRLIIAAVPRP